MFFLSFMTIVAVFYICLHSFYVWKHQFSLHRREWEWNEETKHECREEVSKHNVNIMCAFCTLAKECTMISIFLEDSRRKKSKSKLLSCNGLTENHFWGKKKHINSKSFFQILSYCVIQLSKNFGNQLGQSKFLTGLNIIKAQN